MVDLQNRLAAEQMRVVGLRLQAAGAVGLKLSLAAELRGLQKPLVERLKQAARDELPKAGGLNNWVADGKFTTSVRFTGPQLGIRISRKGQFNKDSGIVRHPVFGHRDRKWAETRVTLDWFYGTLNREADKTVTPRVLAALTETRAALMSPL